MNKKAYIQPEQTLMGFENILMQVPASLPEGNGDDPIVDDEGDILSKKRHSDGWGDLW
ncbi:MAG: hypothetical protein Q4E32_08905 [Bacteroidales bacterium]|nr:hypothetical protein [Bacteroidales bacterium]